MKNKFKIAVLSATTMFLPFFSFAYDGESEIGGMAQIPKSQEMRGDTKDIKRETKDARAEAIKVLNEDKAKVRADINEKQDMFKTDTKDRRDALKVDIMQKREALKSEIRNLPKEQVRKMRDAVRIEIKEKRADFLDTVKDKRDAFKDRAKERIDILKEKFSEDRAKKIEAFFGGMVRKFEAAINRFRHLADRIDSRLDKFEDEGKDVSALRISLDNARNSIESAEDALDKAKEEFTTFVLSENPKENFEKVKAVVQNVASAVKNAHKALVDVINSIKGASDNNQ